MREISGADLTKPANLPGNSGQVPADSGSLHRGHYCSVLRRAAQARSYARGYYSFLQFGRNRRQLWVAWFGIRVNTFANSRTAFASLRGKPYPIYQIPLEAAMSIGMMLISVDCCIMLLISLIHHPGDYAGPCLHRLCDW